MVALLVGGATTAAAPRPAPKTHTVTIAEMRFTPETIDVARGDTILWVNKDLVPHSVTSPAGTFDSKSIAPSASWRYTVRRAGRFAYVCTFHPTMTAAFRVK